MMPTPPRAASVTVRGFRSVLLCLMPCLGFGLVAGCLPVSDYEKQRQAAEAEDRADSAWLDEFDGAPVMRGKVIGYFQGAPVLETGRFDTHVPLARIWSGSCAGMTEARFARRVKELLPIGAEVVAVASRPDDSEYQHGRDDTITYPAFAYTSGDTFARDWQPGETTTGTVNEQLVCEGFAVEDPPSGGLFRSLPLTAHQAHAGLSRFDTAYWLTFVRAHEHSWANRSGPTGACREVTERREEEQPRQLRERRQRESQTYTYDPSCDGDGDGICYE